MKFYRYEGYDTYHLHNPEVFISVSETPCGYWIVQEGYRLNMYKKNPIEFNRFRKWIPKISKKRFAYPTKEEAFESYIARKKMQIQYCRGILELAEKGLKNAIDFRKTGLTL